MGIAPASDLLLVLLGGVVVMLVNAPGVGLHQLGLHLPDKRLLLGLVERVIVKASESSITSLDKDREGRKEAIGYTERPKGLFKSIHS